MFLWKPRIRMDKEGMVHMYNGMLLSHNKKWNNTICSNMDAPRDHHTKWNKLEDNYHTISLICRILKNDTNELIYKTETGLKI